MCTVLGPQLLGAAGAALQPESMPAGLLLTRGGLCSVVGARRAGRRLQVTEHAVQDDFSSRQSHSGGVKPADCGSFQSHSHGWQNGVSSALLQPASASDGLAGGIPASCPRAFHRQLV